MNVVIKYIQFMLEVECQLLKLVDEERILMIIVMKNVLRTVLDILKNVDILKIKRNSKSIMITV
jgi:hypothetical protein